MKVRRAMGGVRSPWLFGALLGVLGCTSAAGAGPPGGADPGMESVGETVEGAPAPVEGDPVDGEPVPGGADAGADPDTLRLAARPLAWEDLEDGHFPAAWRLPEAPADPDLDLVARLEALLAASFEVAVEDGPQRMTFGDLARVAGGVPPEQRADWVNGLERLAPAAFEAFGPELRALLSDGELGTDRWRPDRDSAGDGILRGPDWDLGTEAERAWANGRSGVVLQAATLIRADLVALKAAENDYRLYPGHVGASYEAIHPLEDTHFRGTDPRGEAFSVHRMYFRCDLPFPFSNYECELHVLARLDAAGRLVTDIHSKSSDFHYMGGRDTMLPVHASDGAWVGYLDVRRFGFDLDGVPDGKGDRWTALRGSLGNLRREAERLFAESGGVRRADRARVPEGDVLGRRP